MKVSYKYKDLITEDIRDIVYNNKLEENTQYIYEEYLPYQVFVTGSTFFKDVSIVVDNTFDPYCQESATDFSLDSLFSDIPTNCAAACSGGIDSSVVSLFVKPDILYTGYYSEPGFSEIPYAKSVADKIGASHLTFKLTETDYINAIDSFLGIVCTPIAGLGGVSEYLCLSKFMTECELSNTKIDTVFFGNGGDEVFLGYFYNHMIRHLIALAEEEHPYMENFKPYRRSFVYSNMDLLLERLVTRGAPYIEYSPVIDIVRKYTDYIDKMLNININMTLPALLHLNNQMCKANKIKGINPLSSKILFDRAKAFNTPFTEKPKKALVDMCKDLPEIIVNRTDKMGFPIPLHTWSTLSAMVQEAVERTGETYTGLTRRAWGLFMIERWKNVFN